MELQTSGSFYNGENNSRSITVIIEENLRDKDIYLDFETADGTKWQSEKLTLDENGEAIYLIPQNVLTGVGTGYIQIIAKGNNFIQKSKWYGFKVRESINATTKLEYNTLEIFENGEYNVKDYDSVKVNVESLIPSGEIEITSTESVDVTNYASAKVVDENLTSENIAKDISILGITGTFEGGITPSGELEITENGTYDVTNYASANVNISNTITYTGNPFTYETGEEVESIYFNTHLSVEEVTEILSNESLNSKIESDNCVLFTHESFAGEFFQILIRKYTNQNDETGYIIYENSPRLIFSSIDLGCEEALEYGSGYLMTVTGIKAGWHEGSGLILNNTSCDYSEFLYTEAEKTLLNKLFSKNTPFTPITNVDVDVVTELPTASE